MRFIPTSDPACIHIGQPVQDDVDVGTALRDGHEVLVKVFPGSSILSPGKSTGLIEAIARVLSPVAEGEIGTIRCIGLNVRHALRTFEASLGSRLIPEVQTTCSRGQDVHSEHPYSLLV